MVMTQEEPAYGLETRVLVEVLPHPGHASVAFLPGVIKEYLGRIDLYDGRVKQKDVDFPVTQHHYLIELDEGGEVTNCESRLFPDFRYKQFK